jgi:hypothetical protein
MTGGVADWVSTHADGLRAISTTLKVVSAAAGALSFIPILSPIFAPIAGLTAVGALGIDAALVATGHGDWKALAVDAALMALPAAGRLGARALATAKRAAALTPEGAELAQVGTHAVDETRSLGLSAADSWARPATLARHFADHGADFGSSSAEEYASRASLFLQRSQVLRLATKIDGKGVIRTYDHVTNEFGSYSATGATRTYFAPDPARHGFSTNWDYWLAQPGVEPWGR